jgi:hypothetical protein
MNALRKLITMAEYRFAARRLRRAPGFSAATILVLALGVGATTAVFSLVNGVLLQPLPYPESHRLVRLTHTATVANLTTLEQSDGTVMLYQRDAKAFDGIAAWRYDDGNVAPSERNRTRSASTSRGSRRICSTSCASASAGQKLRDR